MCCLYFLAPSMPWCFFCQVITIALFLPSLFSHSITIDEIPGHKSWKEGRTVLKPRSPKLVSYASDFLYETSFSFFGIWFFIGTHGKADGFLKSLSFQVTTIVCPFVNLSSLQLIVNGFLDYSFSVAKEEELGLWSVLHAITIHQILNVV